LDHLGLQGGSVGVISLDLASKDGCVLGPLGGVEGIFSIFSGLNETSKDTLLNVPGGGIRLDGRSEVGENSTAEGSGKVVLGSAGGTLGGSPGGLCSGSGLDECTSIGGAGTGSSLDGGVSGGLLLGGEGELTLGGSTGGTIIDVGGQVGGSEGGSLVKSTSLTAVGKSVEFSELGVSSEDSGAEPCDGGSGGSGGGLEGGECLSGSVEGGLGSAGGGLGSSYGGIISSA